MKHRLLAVLIAAAPAAAADFTDLPAIPKFAPAPILAHASGATRRPRVATMTGAMNHAPLDLTFNRVEWTIKGGIGGAAVDVKIDHDKQKITGGANLSPVDLSFTFSDESYGVEGGANLSPVKYDIVWAKGTLDGYANHSPVHLDFSLQDGTAKGYANHSPVELKLDAVSGHLTGAMNYSPVDATLTNMDLSDFLQSFYLFLKQQP